MVVVFSCECRATARPLFTVMCGKAVETTHTSLENRNETDYPEETPEVGPCHICPQKTAVAYSTCRAALRSPSHHTSTDRACV